MIVPGRLVVFVRLLPAGVGVRPGAVVGVQMRRRLDVEDTRVVRRLGLSTVRGVTVHDAATEADDGGQTDGGEKRSTEHDGFPQLSYRPVTSRRR